MKFNRKVKSSREIKRQGGEMLEEEKESYLFIYRIGR